MSDLASRLDDARERLQAAPITEEPFYSPQSLAEKLAISERTVRTMLNRGDLPCYRIGLQRRIDPADVRRWLEERRERR